MEAAEMAKQRRQQPACRRRWKTSRILTWIGLGCLALTIVVLGLLAFTGGGSSGPRHNSRQEPVVSDAARVTVDVVDNDFEPSDLTVRRGAEVVWRFRGGAAHDVTEDRGAFESGIMRKGDEFTLTVTEPGTYYYYCTLHHIMQGTLVVQP
jgi:plastocyanin